MRHHFLALGAVAIIAMSGCTNLSQLAKQVPPGDDFNALLSNEYLAYATAESERYDWYDSEYFAKKGLRAASGLNVQPENLADWDVPQEDYDNVMRERRRIVALVNGPARDKYASRVAHAQVLFDCWLEQVDEQWIGSEPSVCAGQFEREIASIESQILLDSPVIPAKNNKKSEPVAMEAQHSIFFGFDMVELSERGRAVIDDISEMVKRMSGYSVNVDGYTDTAGPAEYNQMLSKKRAENVANALADKGVDKARITATGHGEANLLVPTEDGVIEKKNRRVEVRVNGSKVIEEMGASKSDNNDDAKQVPAASNSRVENEAANVSVEEQATVEADESLAGDRELQMKLDAKPFAAQMPEVAPIVEDIQQPSL